MSKIIYQLDGTAETRHHLNLSVLAEKISRLQKFLAASAKELGRGRVVFQVTNISHSSPAALTCEPQSDAVPAAEVAARIAEDLSAANRGHFEKLPPPVLSAFRKLAESSAGKVSAEEVRVVAGGRDVVACKLGETFQAESRAKDLPPAKPPQNSAVDGRLEEISIHAGARKFKIYDLDYVTECNFPEEMLPQVQGALGRYVEVRGECVYRRGNPFPHKIDVREMKILPPRDESPTLYDLYGIAPDATGGKSSEDFVREVRAQWDEREKKLYGES